MITFRRANLQEALSKARLVAQRSPAIPMSGSVLLTARPQDAWFTVTAMSQEAQIALDVEADVGEDLSLCVDSERLALALNAPGEEMKLSIEGERMKLVCGKSIFRLPHLPSADFPLMTTASDLIVKFDCPWIAVAMARILPFVFGEGHPSTSARGVSISRRAGEFCVEGTTGGSGAQLRVKGECPAEFDFMLTKRIADAVRSMEPDRATLRVGALTLSSDSMRLTTKLLDAKMPDMANALKRGANSFTVKREEAVAAMKAAAGLSDIQLKRWRLLRLRNDDTTLHIASVGSEGDAAIEVPLVGFQGKHIDAEFDISVLLAIFGTTDMDDITITFDDAGRIVVDEDDIRAAAMRFRT